MYKIYCSYSELHNITSFFFLQLTFECFCFFGFKMKTWYYIEDKNCFCQSTQTNRKRTFEHKGQQQRKHCFTYWSGTILYRQFEEKSKTLSKLSSYRSNFNLLLPTAENKNDTKWGAIELPTWFYLQFAKELPVHSIWLGEWLRNISKDLHS